ncbi:MAG TPA: amidohydrolase [Dehalococcoidales bacterium]|nr:amidohydrolase [Dehalococcoidales bacterium]
MSADLILENADIVTCNPLQPKAEALAIKGGYILRVGTQTQISALSTAGTRIINCQGATLVPGFNDAHYHYFATLRRQLSLDLSPATVRSIQDIQSAIRDKIPHLKPGSWITGTGYNEFYLTDKRHPNCRDLDAAAPENPVIIIHRSLHACVLNSTALRLVGISSESEEPPGGLIDRFLDSGEPNGLLFEMLDWVQTRIHSPLSSNEFLAGVEEVNRRNLEMGITSFTDATVTNDRKQYHSFYELVGSGKIKSRVNLMLGFEHMAEAIEIHKEIKQGTRLIKTGCLKIVISNATGRMRPQQTELNRMVLEANQHGFQVAVHAVEKEAVEATATALEYARRNLRGIELRNRLEHCSECPQELAVRLSKLRAVVVTQPSFLYYQGERYLSEIDVQTQAYLYPFKSLIEAGVKVAGSSDSPVVSGHPLTGIHSAVNRLAESGQALLPSERLSPVTALEMFTVNAAFASFEETVKGTLFDGQLADMVLLSDNPLSCHPEKIKEIKVLKTLIGGKILWEQ